nr:MAG TPA: hypothetical protein [Caudoviricetes sp.]
MKRTASAGTLTAQKVKLESLHANYIKSGGKIKWI